MGEATLSEEERLRRIAEEEERRHFQDCVCAFQEYELDMLGEVARREQHYSQIPAAQLSRLPTDCLQLKLKKLKLCVKVNQNFCNRIIESHLEHQPPILSNRMHTAPHNASKVRSCFHQCAREWSEEGKAERDACFTPIIEQLQANLEPGSRVLCPGAGM